MNNDNYKDILEKLKELKKIAKEEKIIKKDTIFILDDKYDESINFIEVNSGKELTKKISYSKF